MKTYYLKCKNRICLSFEADEKLTTLSNIKLLDDFIFIKQKYNEYSPRQWLEFILNISLIPMQRPNYKGLIENFLNYKKLILNNNYLNLCNSFWICSQEESNKLNWEDVNYFDHFNNDSCNYFLDYKAKLTETNRLQIKSPSWFIDGDMLKAWVEVDGEIYLYKRNSKFANKNLYDVYSEYFASQVAKFLNLPAVDYKITKYGKHYISDCKLFTNKDFSFIPFSKIIDPNINGNNLKLCSQIAFYYGKELFEDLMVFDALICNGDRHLNNFGMMLDNNSGILTKPAPIFDFNNSLIFDYPIYLKSIAKTAFLNDYENRKTRFFESFNQQLKIFIRKRHLDWIKQLKKFKFKQPNKIKMDMKYLKFINKFFKKRIKKAEQYLIEKGYIKENER